MQKYLAGIIVLAAVFFGFVIVRIGIAQPSSTIKLAKIPQDQQLGKEAYAKAYPLEYNSFMKNNEMAPSPTGYGGSEAKHSRLEEEPEMLENFKGYKFSLEYNDDRGHTYAGEDILTSKRIPGSRVPASPARHHIPANSMRKWAGNMPASHSLSLLSRYRKMAGLPVQPVMTRIP